MKTKFPAILLITLCILCAYSLADMGPKPRMNIILTLEDKDIPESIFHAKILHCTNESLEKVQELQENQKDDLIPQFRIADFDAQKGCYWMPDPLAWGDECKNSKCTFTYFLPRHFKLAVYLPSTGQVYLSEETKREKFKSQFKGNLLSNGQITLTEEIPEEYALTFKRMLLALGFTIIIEIIAGFAYLSYSGNSSRRALASLAAASVISLPLLWYVMLLFPFRLAMAALIVLEVGIIAFEGFFLYFLNKKTITKRQALVCSTLANLSSFILGFFPFLLPILENRLF